MISSRLFASISCLVPTLLLCLASPGCTRGGISPITLSEQSRKEQRIAEMAAKDSFPTAAQAGLKPVQ